VEKGRLLNTFEVIEQFSGQALNSFELLGYPPPATDQIGRFDDHKDVGIWENTHGRTANDTDCQIPPDFLVGQAYLVFLDQPYTNKSFELIARMTGGMTPHDQWLDHVRGYLTLAAHT
jgi:hypothetical protein